MTSKLIKMEHLHLWRYKYFEKKSLLFQVSLLLLYLLTVAKMSQISGTDPHQEHQVVVRSALNLPKYSQSVSHFQILFSFSNICLLTGDWRHLKTFLLSHLFKFDTISQCDPDVTWQLEVNEFYLKWKLMLDVMGWQQSGWWVVGGQLQCVACNNMGHCQVEPSHWSKQQKHCILICLLTVLHPAHVTVNKILF